MSFTVIEKNGNHVVTPTLTKTFLTNQLIIDLDSNFMNIAVPKNHCSYFHEADSICQQMNTNVQHKKSITQETNTLTVKIMHRNNRYIVKTSHIDTIPVTIYDIKNYSDFQITVRCNLLNINDANESALLWHIKDITFLR